MGGKTGKYEGEAGKKVKVRMTGKREGGKWDRKGQQRKRTRHISGVRENLWYGRMIDVLKDPCPRWNVKLKFLLFYLPPRR